MWLLSAFPRVAISFPQCAVPMGRARPRTLCEAQNETQTKAQVMFGTVFLQKTLGRHRQIPFQSCDHACSEPGTMGMFLGRWGLLVFL